MCKYAVENDESLSSGVSITVEYLMLSGRFGHWLVDETCFRPTSEGCTTVTTHVEAESLDFHDSELGMFMSILPNREVATTITMLETREEGGSRLIPGSRDFLTALLLFADSRTPRNGSWKRGRHFLVGFGFSGPERLPNDDDDDDLVSRLPHTRLALYYASQPAFDLYVCYSCFKPPTLHQALGLQPFRRIAELGFASDSPRSPSLVPPRHYRRSANAQSIPSEAYAAVLAVLNRLDVRSLHSLSF